MLLRSLGGYIERIHEICKKDTSSDPDGWTPENPTWGHCAVVSVLTQELYGGDIWRATLLHVPKFAHLRSHYGNRLSVGAILDLTAPQFGNEYPMLHQELSSREYILGNVATLVRYETLRKRARNLSLRISLHDGAPRAPELLGVSRQPPTK